MKFKFLILFFVLSGLVYSQDKYIDSLNKIIDNIEIPDSSKLKAHNELGKYYVKTDPLKAYGYLKKSLEICKNSDDIIAKKDAYILYGIANKNIGNYNEATKSYFNALELAKKDSDIVTMSMCYNNLGSIYQIQNSFDKALDYYKQSLKIEQELNNKSQISLRYYNIGTIYELKDSNDIAYSYYYNSLLIEQEINNKEGIYYAYYGLAGVDIKRNDYQRAKSYLNKSLNIASELNDKKGMAICYNEIGKLYMQLKDFDISIEKFELSNIIADSIHFKNILKDNYLQLSQIYYHKNDYKKAFNFQKMYLQIYDSLNSVEINSRIAEVESKYKLNIKEQKINFLEEKEILLTKNAKSQKRNRYYLLITLFLLMIFAISNLVRILDQIYTIIASSLALIVLLLIISFVYYISKYSINLNLLLFFNVFVDVFTIAILPIFAGILFTERILLNKHLKTASDLSSKIKEIHNPEIEKEITLIAENNKDKFKLELNDLLYIEANDNYSGIIYLKEGALKTELIRGSLKRMEEQLQQFEEVIRCHKSYIVNIHKIEKVVGNAKGYKLILSNIENEIPVSRSFPKSIIQKIKQNI